MSNLPIANGYTVREKTAPTGYKIDNTAAVTVDVTAAGSCASGAATHTFTDTPLTDLEVDVASQAPGQGILADAATESSIKCVNGEPSAFSSGTDVGDSPDPNTPGDTVDPAKVTASGANGLAPGVYTCRVFIDP